MYLVEALLEYFAARLINRFGPKHAIAASVPFWILHIYQVYSITTLNWPIWTISLSGGVSLALFWQAYHYDFSKAKKKKETTKEISSLYIVIAIIGALSPFVGGVVATRFGIEYIYLLAMILVGLATLILLKTGDRHNPKKRVSLKRLRLSCISKDLISYVGYGLEASSTLMAWPLFVFMIVGSYESLGFLTSVALILSIFVMYYVGKRADQGERRKFLMFGDIATGIVYAFHVFASTALHVGLANTIRNTFHSFASSPFVSEYYLHADEEGRSEYLLAMETAVDLGRAAYFSALYLLTFALSTRQVLIVAILVGAAGIFVASIMPPAKCELPISDKKIKVGRRPMPKKAGV